MKVVESLKDFSNVVALETSQVPRGWLKLVASLNMLSIFATSEMFQVSRGWLKRVAHSVVLRRCGNMATQETCDVKLMRCRSTLNF